MPGPVIETDPFEIFSRPPPNETPEERVEREGRETEAKKISDQIDEDIRREKAALKKNQYTVRVLLLGQAESGKSTTLKNFRMRYAQEEWQAELESWRAVIQLNLIRSVTSILDALQSEIDSDNDPPPTPSGEIEYLHGGESPTVSTPTFDLITNFEPSAASSSSAPSPSLLTPVSTVHGASTQRRPSVSRDLQRLQPKGSSNSLRKGVVSNNANPVITGQHQLLKLKLAPLRRVEADLRKQLGASADDEEADGATGDEYGELGRPGGAGVGGSTSRRGSLRRKPTTSREFSVRRLKDALTHNNTSGLSVGRHQRGHSRGNSDGSVEAPSDEATDVIAKCRDDVKALWADETIRMILKKRKIKLEDSAGFFLDDVDRIATPNYLPSDDDVVRARLRTLGVQEYKIKVDQPTSALASAIVGVGTEWSLYDVGGSRTLRHAWLPYFENVTAIIFLAPVSCFDERLLEDSRINRLEDSFLLWRTVCSSKLLDKTSLILFMNKCDLLKRKLKMGVKVNNYLPSYGDRPNDAASVVKYLKEKFRDIVKSHAPEGGRVAYYYATSVTDTKTTFSTLKAVKDIILRDHLKSADFV